MHMVHTRYGDLVPQRTTDDLRRKELLPVDLYEDGSPRGLPLETQVLIDTPAGVVPAEFISFYPDGSLNRVFPLNGRLSGYWTQDDEARLSEPVRLQTPVGELHARVISVSFYKTQALRSLTLWPGEVVSVQTPAGLIKTRTGVSFYPDGSIRSLEPAAPVAVKTPVGEIMAFDPDAVGVNGDCNSLVFNPDGSVRSLCTVSSRVTAFMPDGTRTVCCPQWRESICGDTEREITPMAILFDGGDVVIRSSAEDASVRFDGDRAVVFAGRWEGMHVARFAGMPLLPRTSCSH